MRIFDLTEKVQWSNRTIGADEIVWVDAEKVRASWSKDRYSYFDNDEHPNAITGRIPRFDAWVKQGIPVQAPEVCLTDDGEISFTNGRHRFTWMLAHGEKTVPVAVPPDYVDAVKAKFGI
jgi:hypothetical protein